MLTWFLGTLLRWLLSERKILNGAKVAIKIATKHFIVKRPAED